MKTWWKNHGTLDHVLLIIGLIWILMIPTMIIIFCIYGSVPDTLIQCVMGSSSIELVVAAWIKTTKVKEGTDEPGEHDISSDGTDGD